MHMKYYVVDAFSENLFSGNPAGVCILEEMIEEELMQKIAAENNLSETAFVYEVADGYKLKWFTPKAEVDLCGHATLATAHIIATEIHPDQKKMRFNTLSGILEVEKKGDLYEMDFPSRKPKLVMWTNDMEAAFGIKAEEAYVARDLIIPLESEKMVRELRPDFSKIAVLTHGMGVIVTAKGEAVDFVSRCFYPRIGIDEDPVTGSAYAALTPYWSEILNKKTMTAEQLSERGGTVYCEQRGDRVKVSGRAKTYLEGKLLL